MIIKLTDKVCCPHCQDEIESGLTALDFFPLGLDDKPTENMVSDECGSCGGSYALEYRRSTDDIEFRKD